MNLRVSIAILVIGLAPVAASSRAASEPPGWPDGRESAGAVTNADRAGVPDPMNGTWEELAPGAPPPARYGHSVVLDMLRDRLIVFGGRGATSELNDVWALSLAGPPAWTPLTPAGTPPSARRHAAAIYDPVRYRLIIFGGYDGTSNNDVWQLSLQNSVAWTQILPAGSPPSPRIAASAIYDPVGDRMVVFGGSTFVNDVWSLSLSGTPTWTQLIVPGSAPAARYHQSAIYDPVRGRMIVFGGLATSGFASDTWALSLSDVPAWTQLAPGAGGPAARDAHRSIYDPVQDRMVMFGGWNGTHLADVWELSLNDTPSWLPLFPGGVPAPGRAWHSAVYDAIRNRLVTFGGEGDSFASLNDAWALDWGSLTAVDDPGAGRAGIVRPPAPNPSAGAVALRFSLPRAGRVRVCVLDAQGRQVRRLADGDLAAGEGAVTWTGTDEAGAAAPAGVYFVRFDGPGLGDTRRIALVR